MSPEFFVLPEVFLAGWFLLNRRSARKTVAAHSNEDAMLQHLRDYLHKGYHVATRKGLLALTEKASEKAFRCKRQSFFLPEKAGGWTLGQSPLNSNESALLTAIATQGQPIDRRIENSALSPELLQAAYILMDHYGINVLVPVRDSMGPQWVWASYFAERHSTPAVDALLAWQMAMQSVVERGALRVASAQLAELEKDATSATQVLRVLLPEAPIDAQEGLEWAGTLRRKRGEPPVLFSAYPQGGGRTLIVFSEITAPGLAAVLLGAALRGYCDSLVVASRGTALSPTDSKQTLRPEKVLSALNRYIWRPDQSNNLSCVVALFDTQEQCVDYAIAGNPCWLHLESGGATVAVSSPGPGLGISEQVDYVSQAMPISAGDTHLFIGGELCLEAFGEVGLAKQSRASRDVSFEGLGQQVDRLAETMGQLGDGRTPGVVLLRPRR